MEILACVISIFIPRATYRLGAGACIATIARVPIHSGVWEDNHFSARGPDCVDTVCLHGDVFARWGTGARTDRLLLGG